MSKFLQATHNSRSAQKPSRSASLGGLTLLARLRVPPLPSSGSEVVVDVDMIDLQVVFELSGLEILDDDALPQRVRF